MNTIAPIERDHMLQIGDYVPKAGIYTKPGVISKISENGDVEVNTDPAEIDHYHRYTITTGLTPEEKDKFNLIMDDVMKMSTNDERLNSLQHTIDELRNDPANKKVSVALRNQQGVLIRLSRELPKVYQINPVELRR